MCKVTGSEDPPQEYLVFRLAEGCYAISAASVVQIFRAVKINPFPKAPRVIEGVINLRGQIVPVLDIRSRFNHQPKSVAASDRFIVAKAKGRLVALRVDSTIAVEMLAPADIEPADTLGSGIAYIAGVVPRPDGVMLIHDLDGFLTEAEQQSLADLDSAETAA